MTPQDKLERATEAVDNLESAITEASDALTALCRDAPSNLQDHTSELLDAVKRIESNFNDTDFSVLEGYEDDEEDDE